MGRHFHDNCVIYCVRLVLKVVRMVIEFSTTYQAANTGHVSGVTSYKSLNVEDSAMNIYVDFIWIKCNFVT